MYIYINSAEWNGSAARETRRLRESHKICSRVDSRLVSKPGHSDSGAYTFNHDYLLAIVREWREVKVSQFLSVASVFCFEKEKEREWGREGRREKRERRNRKLALELCAGQTNVST